MVDALRINFEQITLPLSYQETINFCNSNKLLYGECLDDSYWIVKGMHNYGFDITCFNGNTTLTNVRKYFILETVMQSNMEFMKQVTNPYVWSKYIQHNLGYRNLINDENIAKVETIMRVVTLLHSKEKIRMDDLYFLIDNVPEYERYFILDGLSNKKPTEKEQATLKWIWNDLKNDGHDRDEELEEDEYMNDDFVQSIMEQITTELLTDKKYSSALYFINEIASMINYENDGISLYTETITNILETSDNEEQISKFINLVFRSMAAHSDDALDTYEYLQMFVPQQYLDYLKRMNTIPFKIVNNTGL